MIKQFIALSSIAVCCLGNPSHAFTPVNHWYKKLNSIGVTTMVQEKCSYNDGHLATYNAYTNVMCITTEVTDQDLPTVLAHESVHVLQDCIAGMSNGQFSSITRYLSNGDRAKEKQMDRMLIQRLHDENLINHVITVTGGLTKLGAFSEVEAYALQHDPDAVFELLAECK